MSNQHINPPINSAWVFNSVRYIVVNVFTRDSSKYAVFYDANKRNITVNGSSRRKKFPTYLEEFKIVALPLSNQWKYTEKQFFLDENDVDQIINYAISEENFTFFVKLYNEGVSTIEQFRLQIVELIIKELHLFKKEPGIKEITEEEVLSGDEE